ncbi:hypothetical protein [uncultured Flavobacterium sp.]|uniref:hypothetical protein n=1 Tax=uncultured Flavobacterium sp. TaxID=165435 RepID=UPI0025CFE377|nr:hypothetical protein [uncultured Flavobacterium sp.]
MKRLNFLLAGLIAISTASCSDDDSTSTTGNANAIRNNVTSGTWRITNYTDDGENETHHFNGYNFTFGENGVLTATNGTNTYTGVWSVTSDNSGDDDDDNGRDDIDFNISFSSPEAFEDELTDDWDVESRTGNRITLSDISGGNGGTDRVVFEKN